MRVGARAVHHDEARRRSCLVRTTCTHFAAAGLDAEGAEAMLGMLSATIGADVREICGRRAASAWRARRTLALLGERGGLMFRVVIVVPDRAGCVSDSDQLL